MNTLKEGFFWVCVVCGFALIFIPFEKIWEQPKKDVIKSIWIEYNKPKEKLHGGKSYNDLKKIDDTHYLFIGKDLQGNTFDSTIITLNY